MDYDNVHLNVAPMHDILQDALDDVCDVPCNITAKHADAQQLVSTRTSTITKGDALMAIEHVLAETSDPRAVGLPGYFNALQDTFQCNGTFSSGCALIPCIWCDDSGIPNHRMDGRHISTAGQVFEQGEH